LLTAVTLILTWLRSNRCRPIFCLANWHHQRLWLNIDDVQKDFAAKSFFVCCGSCVQSACELLSKYVLITELHNVHIVRQVFFFDYNFQRLNHLGWQFESCVAVCSCSSWEWWFLEYIFHKVG